MSAVSARCRIAAISSAEKRTEMVTLRADGVFAMTAVAELTAARWES